MLLQLLITSFILATCSLAQFVNQDAKYLNLTVLRSPADDNVTISYKEPHGVCNTAFDSQKQYTGWVNLPGDYPTNLFFWFIEAREPTQTLTIWLNGGPGSSSMYGLFAGNGPCEVIESGVNQFDTVAREWGWDRASNMLFIDQPNQVGFSYDTPTNGTLFTPDSSIEQPPVENGGTTPPWALLNGTFSSSNGSHTANTTEIAAMAVWHMVQGFLSSFPQYQPPIAGPVGINLFAESYGGRYGPIFADLWEEQNDKRVTGELPLNSTLELHLISLGIVNGCIDQVTQVPKYPLFANANTYGVKAISDDEANFYAAKFDAEGGCKDLLDQCTTAVLVSDPDGEGDENDVNDVCSRAQKVCYEIENVYFGFGRSAYDMAAPAANPYPSQLFLDYLNQAAFQQAIGSPVNFTLSNDKVFSEFLDTGDISRGGTISKLADLLNRGVRVGLIYGDRDYICNWFGGEAVSLGLAWETSADYGNKFSTAGYAPIIVNDSYVGGMVRQYGNLSFSRVYQAGHSVAWYQPETAFQVFARIVMGSSISTGETIDLGLYNTTGPLNTTHTDKPPDFPEPTCYVRAFRDTCDQDAVNLANSGDGVVINGVLYSSSGEWGAITRTPTSTSAPSATETLTGLYTATETPDNAAEPLLTAGFPAWGAGLFVGHYLLLV